MDGAGISVIVPVFNGEAYIAEALDSIFAQTLVPREVLVIDDGSTDGTREVVAGYGDKLVYHRQGNRGPAAARNEGPERAAGTMIAFLDADDLWPLDVLAESSRVLENEPAIGVVLGRTRFLKHAERPDGGTDWQEALAPRFYLQLGSALIRRGIFDAVGHFDASLPYSEDIDWFIRARERGVCIRTTERIALLHRLHAGNMTGSASLADFRLAAVLKNSLDRRKAATLGRATPLAPLEPLPRPNPEAQE